MRISYWSSDVSLPIFGEQPRAGGDQLGQLDVGGPELLEGLAQRMRPALAARPCPRTRRSCGRPAAQACRGVGPYGSSRSAPGDLARHQTFHPRGQLLGVIRLRVIFSTEERRGGKEGVST